MGVVLVDHVGVFIEELAYGLEVVRQDILGNLVLFAVEHALKLQLALK